MYSQAALDAKHRKVMGLSAPRPKVRRARKCFRCTKALDFHFQWNLCRDCAEWLNEGYNNSRCPRCHGSITYDEWYDRNMCGICHDII